MSKVLKTYINNPTVPVYLLNEVDDLSEVLNFPEELLHGAVVVLVDGDGVLVVVSEVGLRLQVLEPVARGSHLKVFFYLKQFI
jgi:hypothetical protein